MKDVSHLIGPAPVLGIWLLGTVTGYCFCSPEGQSEEPSIAAKAAKYQKDETDLLYYGYRYYNASTGRWLSRDPAGERAGPNAYAFVLNDPITKYDIVGLLHAGQIIQLGDSCQAKVIHYSPRPFRAYGDRPFLTEVGAYLKIEVHCDCSGCGCYKWRQHYTRFEDETRVSDNVLDNSGRSSDWYLGPEEPTTDCTYTFQDQPHQLPPPGMYYHTTGFVQRVAVSFRLELVKLADCASSSGGTPVGSIRWGFWYTRDANGLLNWDPHE
jgi:RHS repeat-associated protein